MASIATLFRPKEFNEVCGQKSIVQILQKQIETKQIKNTYLFCGPSGTGKTTLARIFANKINDGLGTPIEIDAASNNGVDNVRALIQSANERALDCVYKVIIVDECHSISVQGWQAFLKCIEEPPRYTIFIFCTTDPQKIPSTILNRVMRFNLTRVSTQEVYNRLLYISEKEGFTNYKESCDYISKITNGGVRDAIATLEKASCYSTNLSIENTLVALGTFSYKMFFDLTDSILDKRKDIILKIIEKCYNDGGDLKLFISNYMDFILDINKYIIFKSMDILKIPLSMEEDIKYTIGVEGIEVKAKELMESVLDIYNKVKQDTMPKTTISIELLEVCDRL